MTRSRSPSRFDSVVLLLFALSFVAHLVIRHYYPGGFLDWGSLLVVALVLFGPHNYPLRDGARRVLVNESQRTQP